MTSPSSRVLCIMGSGEMAPRMATVHADLIGRVEAAGRVVMLDTPYGFQENADELSQRAIAYFRDKVGHPIRIASLRDRESSDSIALERLYNELLDARYIFAGPGSPSYALRHWRDSMVAALLGERLRDGGCVTFASAAAIALGRFALPVYEIYKVGEPAHWVDGLDLLRSLGLDVVIPHYDNTEGGSHDTRYCYMGEARLRRLERQLPPAATIAGVAEHTAAVIDLEAGTLEVRGRGFVALRRDGVERRYAHGVRVSLGEVLHETGTAIADVTVAVAGPNGGASNAETARAGEVDGYRLAFQRALNRSDAEAALSALLELEDQLALWSAGGMSRPALERARSVFRGMLVRLGEALKGAIAGQREPVAPFVELALRLRDEARRDRRYPEADLVRDVLQELGIEVRDTPIGPEWSATSNTH